MPNIAERLLYVEGNCFELLQVPFVMQLNGTCEVAKCNRICGVPRRMLSPLILHPAHLLKASVNGTRVLMSGAGLEQDMFKLALRL
jgi:hypothetical protein